MSDLDPIFDTEKMFELLLNDERTKNNEFLHSLHTGFKTYGSLTERQQLKFIENFDKNFNRDGTPKDTQKAGAGGGQFKFTAKNTLANLYRNTPEAMREKTKAFSQWYLVEYEKAQTSVTTTTTSHNDPTYATASKPAADLTKGIFDEFAL